MDITEKQISPLMSNDRKMINVYLYIDCQVFN